MRDLIAVLMGEETSEASAEDLEDYYEWHRRLIERAACRTAQRFPRELRRRMKRAIRRRS